MVRLARPFRSILRSGAIARVALLDTNGNSLKATAIRRGYHLCSRGGGFALPYTNPLPRDGGLCSQPVLARSDLCRVCSSGEASLVARGSSAGCSLLLALSELRRKLFRKLRHALCHAFLRRERLCTRPALHRRLCSPPCSRFFGWL